MMTRLFQILATVTRKMLPFGIIILGIGFTLTAYYFDMIRGGGSFGLFGTSIFLMGIYLVVTGAFLLLEKQILGEFCHLITPFIHHFKILVLLIPIYLIISMVLILLDLASTFIFFIQLPIFPVAILNNILPFFLPNFISSILSLIIGIPLTLIIWYGVLLRPVRESLGSVTNIENFSQIAQNNIEVQFSFKYVCLIIGITFFLRAFTYLFNIPGADTPRYLRIAIDFMESRSISDILNHDDFFGVFPILLFSLFCGFNPGMVPVAASFYTPTISVVSCILLMKILRNLKVNSRAILFAGLFYAFSPVLIHVSPSGFKQEFALMIMFLSIYLYTYQDSKMRATPIKKMILTVCAIICFVFAILYYYLLMIFGFYLLFSIIIKRKRKTLLITVILLNIFVFIGIFLLFNYFKEVPLVNSVLNFFYWNIYMNQIAPVSIIDINFLFWVGPLLFYTPFYIFGILFYYKNRESLGVKPWRIVVMVMFVIFSLSITPLFGILPNYYRLMQLLEYPIIFFSAMGVEPLYQFIRERMALTSPNRHFKKVLFLFRNSIKKRQVFVIFLLAFLGTSYMLNYPNYSNGFFTQEEKNGFNYLRENSDYSLFVNTNLTDAIILPPLGLQKWTEFYFSFNSSRYPETHESLMAFYSEDPITGKVYLAKRNTYSMCYELNATFSKYMYIITSINHQNGLPINEILLQLQGSYSITVNTFYQNSEITIYECIK